MKNKVLTIALITCIVIITFLVCFIIIDKTSNEENKESSNTTQEKTNTNEVLVKKIGDFGDQTTSIKYCMAENCDKLSPIEANIDSNGNLVVKNHYYNLEPTDVGRNMTISGLKEKVIRVIKGVTCADDVFDVLVLTENGNVYQASYRNSSVSLDFVKISTNKTLYGITKHMLDNENITCSSSYFTVFDEEGIEYVIQPKISSGSEWGAEYIDKDENGNNIYEANVKYEDYVKSFNSNR